MRRRDSLERCIHDVVREEEHNALFAEIFLVLLQTKTSQVGVRGESDALRHGGCSAKEGTRSVSSNSVTSTVKNEEREEVSGKVPGTICHQEGLPTTCARTV